MQGIKQIQAELQQLRSEPSPLNAARAKLTEYATDKEKLERVIESLQVSYATVQCDVHQKPCAEHLASGASRLLGLSSYHCLMPALPGNVCGCLKQECFVRSFPPTEHRGLLQRKPHLCVSWVASAWQNLYAMQTTHLLDSRFGLWLEATCCMLVSSSLP